MKQFTVFFIGLVIFIIIVIFSMKSLFKSAAAIHEKLNALKVKAKSAKTVNELTDVWDELKEVNKECWHRSFSNKVMEIKTIIETKYELLKQKIYEKFNK